MNKSVVILKFKCFKFLGKTSILIGGLILRPKSNCLNYEVKHQYL